MILPEDERQKIIQLPPAKLALARTVNASLSSSVSITLNTYTTLIRVYAKTQDVYLKFGSNACTASNFDHVIPAGQIVDIIPPAGTTAINVIQATASASVVIIEY